jgi:quinol monooxygenase YgiN
MSKIIFEINYDIHPEKRDDYLNTIKELKGKIRENSNKNYSVYENKKLTNNFSEIFVCESLDEYESIEDNQDDVTIELTEKLYKDFIKNKKVSYTTMYEI